MCYILDSTDIMCKELTIQDTRIVSSVAHDIHSICSHLEEDIDLFPRLEYTTVLYSCVHDPFVLDILEQSVIDLKAETQKTIKVVRAALLNLVVSILKAIGEIHAGHSDYEV